MTEIVKNNPPTIGVFDSGVGGLTVLQAIRQQFPYANLVYFGDTAHVPYGNKSAESIVAYSLANAQFLQKFPVDIMVVACNTSAAIAGVSLRKNITLPMVEVVSAGVQAVASTLGCAPFNEREVSTAKTEIQQKVVVIGTFRTINSKVYSKAILSLHPEVEVVEKACPLFVPLVEENFRNRRILKDIVHEYLDEMVKGAHTMLLGCTHYPLLLNVIRLCYPQKHLRIVDSAFATANALLPHVKKYQLTHVQKKRKGKISIFSSDLNEVFVSLASKMFPRTKVMLKSI